MGGALRGVSVRPASPPIQAPPPHPDSAGRLTDTDVTWLTSHELISASKVALHEASDTRLSYPSRRSRPNRQLGRALLRRSQRLSSSRQARCLRRPCRQMPPPSPCEPSRGAATARGGRPAWHAARTLAEPTKSATVDSRGGNSALAPSWDLCATKAGQASGLADRWDPCTALREIPHQGSSLPGLRAVLASVRRKRTNEGYWVKKETHGLGPKEPLPYIGGVF